METINQRDEPTSLNRSLKMNLMYNLTKINDTIDIILSSGQSLTHFVQLVQKKYINDLGRLKKDHEDILQSFDSAKTEKDTQEEITAENKPTKSSEAAKLNQLLEEGASLADIFNRLFKSKEFNELIEFSKRLKFPRPSKKTKNGKSNDKLLGKKKAHENNLNDAKLSDNESKSKASNTNKKLTDDEILELMKAKFDDPALKKSFIVRKLRKKHLITYYFDFNNGQMNEKVEGSETKLNTKLPMKITLTAVGNSIASLDDLKAFISTVSGSKYYMYTNESNSVLTAYGLMEIKDVKSRFSSKEFMKSFKLKEVKAEAFVFMEELMHGVDLNRLNSENTFTVEDIETFNQKYEELQEKRQYYNDIKKGKI